MRYLRAQAKAGYTVEPQLVIDACIALRTLGRTNPKIDAYSFIAEIADAYYGGSFEVFLAAVVAHVERAQRLADRFQHWRVHKLSRRPIIGKPDPIGTPLRALRRFRDDTIDINAIVATTLAVRAYDREQRKPRAAAFIRTLDVAYNGAVDGLLRALVELAERDRRFARRFRSWRRAKARRQQQGRPR